MLFRYIFPHVGEHFGIDFYSLKIYTGIEKGKSSRILKAGNVCCLAKLSVLLGPIIIFISQRNPYGFGLLFLLFQLTH